MAELTSRQQRREDAGRWLATAGGTCSPGQLAAALETNRARQADVLADLEAAGLVTRRGATVALTTEGWMRFAGVGPGSAGVVLDEVLTGWPAAHRAFLELLVCAVVVRHHLPTYRRHPHLGFMVLGETGSGKTAMAELVCHLFGLDIPSVTVHTPAQTAGSLLGRRASTSDGYVWEPAPMTKRPLVFLDEFDKTPEPVQRQAWLYFQGYVETQAEGLVHQLRAVPLLAANPPARGERLAALRPEYRRRSVVLDAAGASTRALERHLKGFYAGPGGAGPALAAGLGAAIGSSRRGGVRLAG